VNLETRSGHVPIDHSTLLKLKEMHPDIESMSRL